MLGKMCQGWHPSLELEQCETETGLYNEERDCLHWRRVECWMAQWVVWNLHGRKEACDDELKLEEDILFKFNDVSIERGMRTSDVNKPCEWVRNAWRYKQVMVQDLDYVSVVSYPKKGPLRQPTLIL